MPITKSTKTIQKKEENTKPTRRGAAAADGDGKKKRIKEIISIDD